MNIVEKVTAFKLQTRALEEAKMGNVAGTSQKLRAAATRLLDLGEDELAESALEEAENLEKSGQMSSHAVHRPYGAGCACWSSGAGSASPVGAASGWTSTGTSPRSSSVTRRALILLAPT